MLGGRAGGMNPGAESILYVTLGLGQECCWVHLRATSSLYRGQRAEAWQLHSCMTLTRFLPALPAVCRVTPLCLTTFGSGINGSSYSEKRGDGVTAQTEASPMNAEGSLAEPAAGVAPPASEHAGGTPAEEDAAGAAAHRPLPFKRLGVMACSSARMEMHGAGAAAQWLPPGRQKNNLVAEASPDAVALPPMQWRA